MRLESRKYLFDVQRALGLLAEFIDGRDFADYVRDAMRRAAVERQLEIIGEALAQLAKSDPPVAEGISEYRRIIALRNILIHGYADVDDRLVWGVLEVKLPVLSKEVESLLKSE